MPALSILALAARREREGEMRPRGGLVMAGALNTAAAPVVRFPHGSRPALATLLTGQFMGLIDALIVTAETPAAIGSLVILGIGLGLTASPLMAQALSTIPTALVGDASTGLTTTVQLAQVGGVAAFGALYGSLSASLVLGCVFAGCALLGALACILGLRAAKARTAA
jgi:hypothetical protein